LSAEYRPLAAMTRKLARLSKLDGVDRQAIINLPCRLEFVPVGTRLVTEGSEPRDCCVLVKGYACRFKVNEDGERQIVSFHVAGDILDLQHLHLTVADHSVEAITRAEVAWIPKSKLRSVARERPALAEAMWEDTLIDASIFREWVLNVGRREARSRIAHMLCEFATRCEAAGLGSATVFEWPITQDHIADATGLTAVHVNRTPKVLMAEGAIEGGGRSYRVKDWQRLTQIGGFDQMYLHAAAA
jgi:CRP-like cAMP-binding protein